jgi:hypothetical protein
MTLANMKFAIGDDVTVSDRNGQFEARGKVVGRYACGSNLYDVQPNRAESLATRLHAIPEHRLRRVAREVRAYEPKPSATPVHILDEA